jgi:hypothetical protein
MNSLYLDKRNFFSGVDIMKTYNRELRKQRIRETELANHKIKFEYQQVVENHERDKAIERFAATFLRKVNKKNKRRATVWEKQYNLRIAYQLIETWNTHYFALDTDTPLSTRKKISFCL